ncbi:nicotinic acid mononucleotide adenyltransferase [uncultured Algibacter sp.]|uniref:toxin-antitoxin system YwqK family antitoxin n=1 Tax=uncultured Algibacter sp. TaxID=298659 RepID=UPI002631EAFA|nr:nicotinic acid mononucleotide adenyltransferase [uncultured Algibacter sp.]
MKNIAILVIALFTTLSFAQKERTLTLNKETNLIEVVYYHDNGEVSQTGTYTADGKLEGEWLSFDEKGSKLVTAYYKDGKKVGKWIYIIDGKLKEVDYSKNVASI